MTFNNVAYGPGTHVRCDVCRDPEALMEARANSEYLTAALVGNTEAEERAIDHCGFVRRGWRILCAGCAAAAHA